MLNDLIKKQLPSELVDFLHLASDVAAKRGQNLYLVGGFVRDLLLERANFDLDLVVEGDAISLAEELAKTKQAKITVHRRFNTAKIGWAGWTVDVATARSETYARPGALPEVEASNLEKDLLRRDFTINAMAVSLEPNRYGDLIDPFGSRADFEQKLIRILHEKSFVDDATRIWRALRYEQRLDFVLESKTLSLLKRDINYLDTISGDRIRHELFLVLAEEKPEKVLLRVDELGVLVKLNPALKGDTWLVEKYDQARKFYRGERVPVALYMALLAYRLSMCELEQITAYLKLPKTLAQSVFDTVAVKDRRGLLEKLALAPSQIHHLLHNYSALAITANLIAVDSVVASERIQLYLNKLRYIKPVLTGDDLIGAGVPAGPRIKEVLQILLNAWLDGKVKSRAEEEELVKKNQYIK